MFVFLDGNETVKSTIFSPNSKSNVVTLIAGNCPGASDWSTLSTSTDMAMSGCRAWLPLDETDEEGHVIEWTLGSVAVIHGELSNSLSNQSTSSGVN